MKKFEIENAIIQSLQQMDPIIDELKNIGNIYLSIHSTDQLQETYDRLDELYNKTDAVTSEIYSKVEDYVVFIQGFIEDKMDKIENGEDDENFDETHRSSFLQVQPSTESKFYAFIEESQQGPYDKIQLRHLIDNGLMSLNTLVWKQGMSQWQAAKDVDEIKEFFASSKTPLPPPLMP